MGNSCISEGKVNQQLANYLIYKNFDVIACHPPGGHTSFSILNGRRSRGAYLPDLVAIGIINGQQVVLLCECKPTADETSDDVSKLENLDVQHIAWLKFRLQDLIDVNEWSRNISDRLIKVIAFGSGQPSAYTLSKSFLYVLTNEEISKTHIVFSSTNLGNTNI